MTADPMPKERPGASGNDAEKPGRGVWNMARSVNDAPLQSKMQQARPDDRRKEHESDAMGLLARLREIPQSAPDDYWPSTAELQREGIFGLRPVNRLVELRRGKYGHKYDIEKINCGHGTFRWRLHEPNRLGYPKDKHQTVLSLSVREQPAPVPKKEIPWSERRPVTGLELWDSAVRP